MTLCTDRGALEAFRQGERKALERVYWDHVEAVVSFLSRGFTFTSRGRTCRFQGYRDPLDVQVTTQEVFTRAFSHEGRRGYDGLKPYLSYLLAIARNLVIDEFRRGGRLFTVPGEELDQEAAGDGLWGESPEPPDRALERKELRALVQAFVKTLRKRDLLVYQERFVEGRHQSEAARVLGLSRSKVLSAERRIRSGFLKFMRRQDLRAAVALTSLTTGERT